MSTERKPGPWGQNPDVDKVPSPREQQRAAFEQTFRDAGALAEDLMQRVRDGDANAAHMAFDTIFFPANARKYGSRPDIMKGLLEMVLTEVGKKHGWSLVTNMLARRGLDKPGPLLDALERNGAGWSK